MNQQNNSISEEVETMASTALAAASKTPFKIAFMLTLGMGIARVVMALIFVSGLLGIIKLIF